MSALCRTGLHKWDSGFRVFKHYIPEGVGYGAANGTTVFLKPCLRCSKWTEERFRELFDHWSDAVPDSPPYRDALKRHYSFKPKSDWPAGRNTEMQTYRSRAAEVGE